MKMENLRYEKAPPIAILTIDRPEVMNAIDLVTEEKKQIIRESEALEFYPVSETPDDVGGLGVLLVGRAALFDGFGDLAREEEAERNGTLFQDRRDWGTIIRIAHHLSSPITSIPKKSALQL